MLIKSDVETLHPSLRWYPLAMDGNERVLTLLAIHKSRYRPAVDDNHHLGSVEVEDRLEAYRRCHQEDHHVSPHSSSMSQFDEDILMVSYTIKSQLLPTALAIAIAVQYAHNFQTLVVFLYM